MPFTWLLFILGFSLFAFANESTLDDKIDKILKASEKEKAILVKQLKDDISKQKYSRIDSNQTAENNSSIDKKIKNRPSKFLPMAKCGMDKCGMGKCGMDSAPKQIKIDDNMSCGCE